MTLWTRWMETSTLAHILHTSWCITRRNSDSCDIGCLTTTIVHRISSYIASDIAWRSIAYLVLIRQVVVLHGIASSSHHLRHPCLRYFFNFYFLCVVSLPGKHQLSAHLISFVARSLSSSIRFSFFFHFFHSISISQRVQGVLRAGVWWTNVCDHCCSAVSCEWVSQYFGQLTSSEG